MTREGAARIKRQEEILNNLRKSIAECRMTGQMEKAASLKGLLKHEETYLLRLHQAYADRENEGV